MTTVVIVGAGAMGRLFGARLAEAGTDVTLVDVDADLLRALEERGIPLEDESGARDVEVKVSSAAGLDVPVDLFIVFTKGMHTRAAVESISRFAGTGARVLTLQNGLGNPEIIAETFPADRIVKGLAALPADAIDRTGVRSLGSGHLEIGAYTPEGMPWVRETADLLSAAGFDTRLPPDIDVGIWEKVAFNTTLNVLAAVTGMANAQMDSPSGRRVIARLLDEVVAVARSQDVHVDRTRIDSAVAHALVAHGHHRASMLQDLAAGRPLEIESIPGAVIDKAHRADVPVPALETLTDALRMMDTPRQKAGRR